VNHIGPISETAERICAKFTERRVLSLARQGPRSKLKISRDKKRAVLSLQPPAATEWNALAANHVKQQQTRPFRRCGGDFGTCVRFVLGKTYLPLVVIVCCQIARQRQQRDEQSLLETAF